MIKTREALHVVECKSNQLLLDSLC